MGRNLKCLVGTLARLVFWMSCVFLGMSCCDFARGQFEDPLRRSPSNCPSASTQQCCDNGPVFCSVTSTGPYTLLEKYCDVATASSCKCTAILPNCP